MKIRIKKTKLKSYQWKKWEISQIAFALISAIYFMPAYFKNIGIIYIFYYKFLPVFSIVLLLLNLKTKKNIWIFIAIVIFYVSIIISTIINGGNYYDFLMKSIIGIGYCSFTKYYIQKSNSIKYLDALLFVLELYVLINFITVILFHDGLYLIYGYGESYYNAAYFLGHRNNAIEYMIPLIGLIIYRDIYYGKKCSMNLLFTITICTLTSILTWSVNALLCIGFIIVAIAFILIKEKFKLFNVLFLCGCSAGISYAVILLNTLTRYQKLLVTVLHRDATASNRVSIWKRAVSIISKKLLNGYGIEEAHITYSKIGHMSSCHNYFLDYLYLGGIIALFAIILMVILVHLKMKTVKPEIYARVSIPYGAYFILWLATPVHKETIFMMFSFFIITVCLPWEEWIKR